MKMRDGVEMSFKDVVSLFPNADFFRRRKLFQNGACLLPAACCCMPPACCCLLHAARLLCCLLSVQCSPAAVYLVYMSSLSFVCDF
jgi:hypothetical protein